DGIRDATVTGVQTCALPICLRTEPVQYEGSAPAEALIVSDLPLRGQSNRRSRQMNDAIRLVMHAASWRAGKHRVAFQACDDSDRSEERRVGRGGMYRRGAAT